MLAVNVTKNFIMEINIFKALYKMNPNKAFLMSDLDGFINTTILKKGQFFLEENNTENKVGYIIEGSLLSLKYINDKEIVNNFFTTNNWIGNMDGYNFGKNSASILCVKNSKIAWIDSLRLKTFFIENPDLKSFELDMALNIMNKNHDQLLKFKSYLPIERYNLLIEDRPEIFKYFSNIHIASFLGISPETLSRLKKRSQKNS